MEARNLIKKLFADQDFHLSDHQIEQFDIYRQELKEWNSRINLTSLTDDVYIIYKHFIDSLLVARYHQIEDKIRIADVGTGAGFPGIPLKIYHQNIRLSLFESTGKKARFLEYIVAKIGLNGVEIVNGRAETAARLGEYREQFDLVLARAVAKLPVLAEYCLPLVSVGGIFVAYKSNEIEEELRDAGAALEILGGMLHKIEYARINLNSGFLHLEKGVPKDKSIIEHTLIFIHKAKKTPDKYPRRPGVPEKRPL